MISDEHSDPARPSVPSRPASLAELGMLMGVPVRASILLYLSDGSRRPAGELARLTATSPQSASAHLACLVDGGLLAVERQGRHRFFMIASGETAEMIEHLANWIDRPGRPLRHDRSLCDARLCYDHLAGRLGVAVYDRMVERGYLALGRAGEGLSETGTAWCRQHGLRSAVPPGSRRPLVRLCLDWTERRHHLGGHLGAALGGMMLDSGFVTKAARGRAVMLTARGAAFLRRELDLDLPCA